MALTATFKADFETFYSAVEKAQVSLRSFETGAGSVEKSLTRMGNSFSGVKVIQEAHLMTRAMLDAGGMASLTDKEMRKLGTTVGEAAQKMQRMGLEVPPGFQKIADETKNIGKASGVSAGAVSELSSRLAGLFTVGAAIGFGKAIINAGDSIQKMADQTGLTVEQVQRLQYVAGQSGTAVESLVGAVQNLQQRLGDDDAGAAGAMRKLGIHADAFNKLGTYEQMTSLAEAVRGIKDPTEQASVAADLFGKSWKEILPAIKSGMVEVGNQAPIMADQTVESLARVDDAMKRAHQQAITWGGGVVTAIEGAGFALGDFLSKFNSEHFGVSTTQILKAQVEANDPTGLKRAMDAIKGPPIGATAAGPQPVTRSLTEGLEKVTTASRSLKDEWGALVAKVEGSKSAFQDQINLMHAFDGVMGTLDSWNYSNGMATGAPALTNTNGARQIGNGMAAFGPATVPNRARPAAGSLFDGLTTAAPQAILGALQGGGNVGQAVAGTVGAQIGTNLVKNFGTSITNTLGKTFGGAINAVLPGLGTLAAPLIGFVGKLFGGSEESKKVSPLRDEFFKLQGGLETLNPKVQAVIGNLGLVQSVFDAKTVSQYDSAITNLTGAMAAFDGKLDKASGDTNTLGSRVAHLTSISPDLQSSFEHAFSAKTVDDFNLALGGISGALEQQVGTHAHLEELASRYGLALGALGPQFAQGHIDEMSKTLIDDWTTLSGLGGDNDQILRGMAKSFSDLASQAKSTGSEIPESLRAPLEKLSKMGLLVDENGDKLEDLGNLKFGSSLDSHLKDLQGALDGLKETLDKLPGKFADAFANIPRNVDIGVNTRLTSSGAGVWTDEGSGQVDAALGGTITPFGVQYFGSGSRGRVLPFIPRGTDTVPAMLTPGETVRTKGQEAGLEALMKDSLSRSKELTTLIRRLPELNAIAVRDALLQAGRRGA